VTEHIIARCFDNGCTQRDTCLRWTLRDKDRMPHMSLFPYDMQLGDNCPMYLKDESTKTENETYRLDLPDSFNPPTTVTFPSGEISATEIRLKFSTFKLVNCAIGYSPLLFYNLLLDQ